MNLSRRQALAGLGVAMGATVEARAWARVVSAMRTDFTLAGQFTQGGWARGRLPYGAVSATLDAKLVSVARDDGAFFIAFDRDAGPTATLIAHFTDADDLTHPLTIAPRGWDIENINAPFHPPGLPDADFARIRAGELARIAAARAAVTGAQGWRQDFHWAAKGRISGHFGAQRIYHDPSGAVQKGSYHPGLDIALPTGTPYAAPADGVVVLAADVPFTLEGRLLMVDHGMGLSSAFLHSSALLVKEGDRVVQDQPLGLVGMTGRATGPHLHWGVRWQEARLDPLLLVGPIA